MIHVACLTFNPFYENTYIVSETRSGDCAIIDPGCHNRAEQQHLASYIEQNKLKPVLLLNTHCHIDHIMGNGFVSEKYNLPLYMHKGEEATMQSGSLWAAAMGIDAGPQPGKRKYIDEGDAVAIGNERFDILFTPGHSVASICFYNKENKVLIAGDVLFRQSIGRTDLPGGDFETLKKSILEKVYVLPGDVTVYPGHGESTQIDYEKKYNPFVQAA